MSDIEFFPLKKGKATDQQGGAIVATLSRQIDVAVMHISIEGRAIGRDVSRQGYPGTGDLELSLTSQADLDTAKPLILMSYQGCRLQ